MLYEINHKALEEHEMAKVGRKLGGSYLIDLLKQVRKPATVAQLKFILDHNGIKKTATNIRNGLQNLAETNQIIRHDTKPLTFSAK